MTKESSDHTNALIHSNSPYLLQHAHNPVDWYPWGEEALNKAKEEDKPILLSIGYSSCHWCHVMAHESFENDSVAALMNEHFINIKLDREERPDIDQVYMQAVQAMGIQGGWPLNVFLFPDQKPFYAGTYFPKENWLHLLDAISKAYQNNKDQLYKSAIGFTQALNEEVNFNASADVPDIHELKIAYDTLKKRFDEEWGGIRKAPKFPMPSVWQFILQYQYLTGDQSALDHLIFTLDKIAMGGIYDQVGGGFSRYSVDQEWHVPHFEKMLYDNGQLLSLYANAFKVTRKDSYKQVILETVEWLKREMMSPEGGFYSALDADSDGEEGKYYVWTPEEIDQLIPENAEIIKAYYDVRPEGNWESTNVLRRLHTDGQFCATHALTQRELRHLLDTFKTKALAVRSKRVRPGLDSKVISGWNGWALDGILTAYQATGDPILADLARKNATFIKDHLIKNDGTLLRTAGSNIHGFLEDYAAVIKAFIQYYETFFDEKYLRIAEKLTDHVIDQFMDQEDSMFFFTGNKSESLIARKKEIFDNVIPASNSVMAEDLSRLGTLLDKENYKTLSREMYKQVAAQMVSEPEYLSNWGNGLLNLNGQNAEVVLVGNQVDLFGSTLNKEYIPDKVILGTKSESELTLFDYKEPQNGQTTIYVCYNKTCKQPVNNPELALKQLLE